ncbi:TylF/MycF family methyltransferase [Alphaproteobacteria bacterium]|nr:TylF/MycF family methyltransferase [Alphaproteobacteria bacterium]
MFDLVKNVLRPVRRVFTRLFVDPEVLRPHVRKQIWRENNAFRWAAAYIVKNQIKGDYLEFGVWKGNSFIEAYKQIEEFSNTFDNVGLKGVRTANVFEDMKFHAFDSFEGLPRTNDIVVPIQYFEGNYQSEEAVFRANIIKAGLSLEKISISKGWFDDTLTVEKANQIGLSRVACAYVDCDIYESTQSVLGFLTPFLQSGSVIIFDDWFRNRGEAKSGVQGAVNEWLVKNKNLSLQHFHNFDTRTVAFIVQMEKYENGRQLNCV